MVLLAAGAAGAVGGDPEGGGAGWLRRCRVRPGVPGRWPAPRVPADRRDVDPLDDGLPDLVRDDGLGNFAATALDFVAILLMFSQVDALGGFTCPRSPSSTDVRPPPSASRTWCSAPWTGWARRVRDGTLDTLLVRPGAGAGPGRRGPVRAAPAGPDHPGGCWCWAGRWSPARHRLDGRSRCCWCRVMLLSGAVIFGGGVRGGRGVPVRGAGRLRGAELLHVRRQHACCSTRRPSSPRTWCAG